MMTYKLTILIGFLFLLLVPVAHGQTRVLLGPSGCVDYFGNGCLGFATSLELPFGRRYEFDLRDEFSPREFTKGYGTGMANIARAGGIVWLSRSIGIKGGGEYRNLSVAQLSRGAYILSIAPIFRLKFFGAPARLELDYMRQIQNGIDHNGIEMSRMQGGKVALTTRIGCAGAMCFRVDSALEVSHEFTQGNQQCDGTLLPPNPNLLPCPRSGEVGGGFKASFAMEFPRRRGQEKNSF